MYSCAGRSRPSQLGIATKPASVASSQSSSTRDSAALSHTPSDRARLALTELPCRVYGDSENLIAHSPELMSANQTRSRCGITLHAPGELGMKPTGSNAL